MRVQQVPAREEEVHLLWEEQEIANTAPSTRMFDMCVHTWMMDISVLFVLCVCVCVCVLTPDSVFVKRFHHVFFVFEVWDSGLEASRLYVYASLMRRVCGVFVVQVSFVL